MVSAWHGGCGEAGVTVLYKHDRKLVGDSTVTSPLHQVKNLSLLMMLLCMLGLEEPLHQWEWALWRWQVSGVIC